jgi:chemotaxis protein histidine kinase CheA
VERIVKEEQAKHENEVRTILGLVNNIPEVIAEFFRDIDERLLLCENHVLYLRSRNSPSDEPYDPAVLTSLFRDLHTIKGSAASYGFEQLSRIAHEAEDSLEALKHASHSDKSPLFAKLSESLQKMQQERRSIDHTAQMLRGGSEGLVVSIPEQKISHIQRMARALLKERTPHEPNLFEPLLVACAQVRRVPIGKLSETFGTMVNRLAEKLGKKVHFHTSPYETEVEPTFFLGLSEPLVHLFRNAIDHGIEMPSIREALGKPPEGHVGLLVRITEDSVVVEIHDDGAGIDAEQIGHRALVRGLISEAELAQMTSAQKLDLIYCSQFSTRDQVSNISGRGVGMDVVRSRIESMGGRISLETNIGKGTLFRIEIPAGST